MSFSTRELKTTTRPAVASLNGEMLGHDEVCVSRQDLIPVIFFKFYDKLCPGLYVGLILILMLYNPSSAFDLTRKKIRLQVGYPLAPKEKMILN